MTPTESPAVEVAPAPLSTPSPSAPATGDTEPPPPAVTVDSTPPPPAADETKLTPPTVSGYVEASYHVDTSSAKVSHPVPLRVYDPAGNSFTLHAAHLEVTQKFSDAISAVVAIDVGRDALATSGATKYPWANDKQFAFDIQEAYAVYTGGGFALTAGKFVTYEGIEVIKGPLNPTITRGYLFGLAEPFTHTGVKLHYRPTDTFEIGVGLVNGWDLISDTNQGKTVIARIAVTPSESFFAALSGTVGPEQAGNSKNQRASVDLTGAVTLNSYLQIWYQGNFGMEKDAAGAGTGNATWFGFGVQPVLTLGDFTLGGRVEYFVDNKGVRTGFLRDGKYFNATLTPGYKVTAAFKVRAEFRVDFVNEALFTSNITTGFGSNADAKIGRTAAASVEYTF